MKRFLILVCVAIFSACQPLTESSFTSTPSEEANPSFGTPSKLSITSIPSSPAQCPKEDSTLQFNVENAYASVPSGEGNQYFTKYVLEFLNAGGTLQSIVTAFEKETSGPTNQIFHVQDVTGDKIPELIFPYGIWLDIFGCRTGRYELFFVATDPSNLSGLSIIDVIDVNSDGLAEIIVNIDGCMGNRCPSVRVYEWNGVDFQNLIANPNSGDGCGFLSVAPFEVKIQDIDKNGTKEIILSNNDNPWPDIDFPYRKETRICMWNGQNIVVYRSEFDAPHYRFQAVQDGDRAILSGDYDKAIGFYQQAINDKNLEWFTQEKKSHDFWVYHSKYFPGFKEPTPTASPAMIQDPNEYPILAAYAYYRIMLVHVLQNDTVKAESIFNTLQNEFPTESPGNYFPQVASIFWQEYQLSMYIQSSCKMVVDYAKVNTLPTEYLGDWDHGVQSIHYTPESICPFK